MSKRLVRYARAHAKAFLVVIWAAFLIFAGAYCVYFDQLTKMHDIPNAVQAAIVSQENSTNPYNHNVIPRFDSRYSASVSITYGPYNYLPLDLDVYTICERVLGFLGMPIWFVVTNLMFSAAAFFLLNRILDARWRFYAPLAGIVMLFYSFDNVSLTLLLIVASIYVYSRQGKYNRVFAIVLMGLAVMTKIHAIVPFVVLVMFELQRVVLSKDRKVFLEISTGVAASCAIGATLMMPFGIWNVIKSAVLFHADVISRSGTSYGGTLLTELHLASSGYTLVVLAMVMGALVSSLCFRCLADRMMLVSIVFLLVSVKSSQALLIVPGVFLALKITYLAKRGQKTTPQVGSCARNLGEFWMIEEKPPLSLLPVSSGPSLRFR